MSKTVTVTRQPNRYTTVTETKNVTTVVSPATDSLEIHDPGVAGPPNTLSIGDVEVGPVAEVTITGSAPTQVLNFVLPRSGTYIHNQAVSSSTWVITHNMGFYPAVSVVDSGGNTVIGDVTYISENQVSVSFSASFGGKAYLS